MNDKKLNFIYRLIFLVLLVAVFIQPFLSAQKFSPANDEITHLPSGYTYLRTGNFSLNPQHPPLIKLLAAFPLLFMNLQFSPADVALGEWKFGKKFIFENNADKMLLWGRLGPMLISLLLALFIYKWAGEIWGRFEGLFALFFYAFMPNILAHSQFVTTDLGVAAFSFIACYWLWKYYKTHETKYLVLTGIFLGLALGSKFSGLLLIPILVLLIGLKELSSANSFTKNKKRDFFKKSLFVAALGGLVVWAIYFFPADPFFYLKGYKTVYADKNANFMFYLNGNYDPAGWWHYFLEAFLIKTPVAFLLAISAVIIFLKKIKIERTALLFLTVPAALFFVITSWKGYNIGVRYILSVYPFLIVLAAGFPSGLKNLGLRRKTVWLIVIVILGWQLTSTIRIFPHYLAYFNEFVGGPTNGYKYLDDSNLDWGQNLKMLAEYQKSHAGTKVIYHWPFSDPDYYGITDNQALLKTKWWREPSGYYAADINFLIRAKLISFLKNEPSLDWLSLYRPIGRIGYSYLIYEFK